MRYELAIWDPLAIVDADPILHTHIDLTEQEYREMDARLYAMVGEDFISRYEMEPVLPLGLIPPQDVFQAIVRGQSTEWVLAARAEWDKNRRVVVS